MNENCSFLTGPTLERVDKICKVMNVMFEINIINFRNVSADSKLEEARGVSNAWFESWQKRLSWTRGLEVGRRGQGEVSRRKV